MKRKCTCHAHSKESKFSPFEEKISQDLKIRLESNQHMHPYRFVESLYYGDPNVTPDHIKTLQSHSRSGSILLMFESISTFKKKKCFIPKWIKHIPSECILNRKKRILYAPYHVLDIIGLDYKERRTFGRLCTIEVVIYYDHKISSVFRSYHGYYFYKDELTPLFTGNRLSVSLLRKEYNDFMTLFCEEKKHYITDDLESILDATHNQTVFGMVHRIMPKIFVDFIEDKEKRKYIGKLIKNMYKKSKALKQTKCSKKVILKIFIYQGIVKETMVKIINIVGNDDEFELLRHKAMRKQIEIIKYRIYAVVEKLEKRICGHCKMREVHHQRANIKKKYKLCSNCKSIFYCSRSCQKKHWLMFHRNDCTEPM